MKLDNMASVNINDVVNMYQTLVKDWNKKPVNLEKCGKLLSSLKVALTGLSFLPTSTSVPKPQELVLARDVLEIGVQWSVEKNDIPSFERYMAQLKPYYLDYRGILQESPYMYQMLGLNLLLLLAQNRLAEFHTELELLPPNEYNENVYIKHPVQLERFLMEGNYNKVSIFSKGNVPAKSYHVFMDILINTLREEIAACLEKSYQKISFIEARRMLYLESEKDTKSFGAKRGWKLNTKNFYIFEEESESKAEIPSINTIQHMLEYAKELERIV
ncbi:26S proteasome non-ATPase regulatory subunit 8-like [Xenia sp. Carnegie-2017]|uniref:26S proteasome non-ATPase regulatory subunit 8-like n=1 Tax=Xenia sp. Carnegie-2017 TaxID=2897299 RepID=UPI001F047F04|nr:26S proteasome non-ATPase regulatory subunit 8-like [Xenia sp. Carnegie-2017]